MAELRESIIIFAFIHIHIGCKRDVEVFDYGSHMLLELREGGLVPFVQVEC